MHTHLREDESQIKIRIRPHLHGSQKDSPTSAESSPPLVSRLKPRSQAISPSSVGFSMHQIALALAASASAKNHMMRSKRQCFDRFFVNCIFRQMAFRRPYSSSLRQSYMKALQTDEHLQLRILQVHEIFSIRLSSAISAALKRFFLRKWQRIWLLRSTLRSDSRTIHNSFYTWSKAILVKTATKTIAGQKRETPSEGLNFTATSSTFQSDAWRSFQETVSSSMDFKRIVGFIQAFHGCFCRWKWFCHNQTLSRSKMVGVTSSVQRLAQYFVYRGCCFKGRALPIQTSTNSDASDADKTTLQLQDHLRNAHFIMWAEMLPSRQISALKHPQPPTPPSKPVNNYVELQNMINHASPIIMAGTPPAFPMRPFQSLDFAKSNRISPSNILETENCLDTDSYTAAVLMDHHQSLCDQSVGPGYQTRNAKGKSLHIQDVQNLESTLLNSIGDISGDSDSISETSRNPLSGSVFATTLRPQSPSTKAHIRNNIIVPSWGDQGPMGLQRGERSSAHVHVTQKMQAFKMVRSPPLAPMQDALKDRKRFAEAHKEAKAGDEVAHVGWGCFTGVATEFPAASSRKHSSFMSGAIEMRIRMSEELQSKEKTDKKVAIGQLRPSVSLETARQPWVRR